MRETNKDDLKKAYRSEKDSRMRARILAVHMVRVRKKSIGETATDPCSLKGGCMTGSNGMTKGT